MTVHLERVSVLTIAGISISVIVVVGAISAIIVFLYLRSLKRSKGLSQQEMQSEVVLASSDVTRNPMASSVGPDGGNQEL